MPLTLSHAWSVGVLLYPCDAALGYPELSDEPAIVNVRGSKPGG
jgi:hypothetical protein